MDNEMFEHIVEVDPMIEVRMKIPKRITALELKALMSKATKLFNLAEVPIREKPTQKPKVDGRKHNGRKKGSGYELWTKPMIKDMLVLKKNTENMSEVAHVLNEKYNTDYFTGKKCWGKFYYIKKKNLFHKYQDKPVKPMKVQMEERRKEQKKKHRPHANWTLEMVEKLKKYYNIGASNKDIRNYLNESFKVRLRAQQVKDKINYMVSKGELDEKEVSVE
jgi:hypothetical protein